MSQSIELWTPVGRLVTGDVFKSRTTDLDGKPLVVKNGPNAGQQREEYYFGLAIAKNDPMLPGMIKQLTDLARAEWPRHFDPQGNLIARDFSFKWVDGDSTVANKKLKRPCDNEGWPGHIVFHFSTSIKPKCYLRDKAVDGAELSDPQSIKRGYYVQVNFVAKSNGSTESPGLYLNPRFVLMCGFGEEIVGGLDVASTLASLPPANLPPGASATPLANPNPGAHLPPATGVPGTLAAPTPPPVPGVAPPPDTGFARGPVRTMTPKANGATYEQYKTAGWTDEQMVAGGYLVIS